MCLGIFRLRRGPKGPTSPKPFPIFLFFLASVVCFFFWDVTFALFLFDVMVFLVRCLGDGPKLSFPMFWLFFSGLSRVYVVVGVVTCWLLVFFLLACVCYAYRITLLSWRVACLWSDVVHDCHCYCYCSSLQVCLVYMLLPFWENHVVGIFLSSAVSSLRWRCPVWLCCHTFNADPW